jgi:hypothetical protein
VTYALVIRLTGKLDQVADFSTARNTVHESFNTVFGNFALKI